MATALRCGISRVETVTRTHVLWTSDELRSTEHVVVSMDSDGGRLSGTVALSLSGHPAHLHYDVVTDQGWRTRSVAVHLSASSDEHLAIDVTEGVWTVNGAERPDLDGCVDIDLGWTPATNLLPIRRSSIGVGESVETTSAWLRFPEFELVAARQIYERTSDSVWRYRSSSAEAVLETTADGIVTRYGDDLWVARSVRSH